MRILLMEQSGNGEKFTNFVTNCLLPVLLWRNPRSVVIMENASIHHVDVIAM